MRRSLTLALVLLPALAAAAPPVTAIKAGRLLDVVHEKVLENAVIVVEDGRVREIGTTVPAGANVIDLGRHHVLPGFIDAHTHVLLQGYAVAADYEVQLLKESLPYRALRATKAMRIALDHGFTTLRDVGSEGAGFTDVDLKRAVAAGIVAGPRLFVATAGLTPTATSALSGAGFQVSMPRTVDWCDGADDCRRSVRDQIAHGADWIKVYADRAYYKRPDGQIAGVASFTVEEMTAIVDQAHRSRRKVAAHSVTPVGHSIALAAGVDSIEHGAVLDEATVSVMARRKVYWCPTLTTFEFVAGPRGATNPVWKDLLTAAGDSFRRALAAGVPIVLGTDAGGFEWDKINQAEEFRRYVALGMTPWQALRSGTVTAAAMLDQEGTLGVIAPGSRADIVALADDPLQDITATERVSFVMKDGLVVRGP